MPVGWCSFCKRRVVRCPKCGNNCCNGGYGTTESGEWCDLCPAAYEADALLAELDQNISEVRMMKFLLGVLTGIATVALAEWIADRVLDAKLQPHKPSAVPQGSWRDWRP